MKNMIICLGIILLFTAMNSFQLDMNETLISRYRVSMGSIISKVESPDCEDDGNDYADGVELNESEDQT